MGKTWEGIREKDLNFAQDEQDQDRKREGISLCQTKCQIEGEKKNQELNNLARPEGEGKPLEGRLKKEKML